MDPCSGGGGVVESVSLPEGGCSVVLSVTELSVIVGLEEGDLVARGVWTGDVLVGANRSVVVRSSEGTNSSIVDVCSGKATVGEAVCAAEEATGPGTIAAHCTSELLSALLGGQTKGKY